MEFPARLDGVSMKSEVIPHELFMTEKRQTTNHEEKRRETREDFLGEGEIRFAPPLVKFSSNWTIFNGIHAW